MSDEKPKCFITMPITTTEEAVDEYNGDKDHFKHVLECLFIPALKSAGFDPISPKMAGSDIIQAEIIKHIATAELILCDISFLNPNVFFELGIRTALNKPACLVVDDKTEPIPFDMSMNNFYKYNSALEAWHMVEQINKLTEHIKESYNSSDKLNALWKYFGIAQTGVFKPEDLPINEKFDFLMKKMVLLEEKLLDNESTQTEQIRLPIIDNLSPGSLADNEKNVIVKTLLYTGGNKSQAAQKLGISRSTLREKMKLYGIS